MLICWFNKDNYITHIMYNDLTGTALGHFLFLIVLIQHTFMLDPHLCFLIGCVGLLDCWLDCFLFNSLKKFMESV